MLNDYFKKLGIHKDRFYEYIDKINTHWFNVLPLEKDFYLTILLQQISEQIPELIFKWWTCLNKVYLDYYRLSEDLDFNVVYTWNRNWRKFLFQKIEATLSSIFVKLKLEIVDSYKRDENRFYNISARYKSLINDEYQTILFDIKVIEKSELPPVMQKVNSIFINYMTEEPVFENVQIACMDFDEIVSEKLRASLTRKDPAIRDFFDIWYIKNVKWYDVEEIRWLLDIKLQEVDYEYSLDGKYHLLLEQIEKTLKPVLKQKFDFNLKEIYEYVLSFKK